MSSNAKMVQQLQLEGVLNTPAVIDAFKYIDRKDFVLPQDEDVAYEDHPLSIGHGQTISQPYTVAFMLELLDPKPAQTILDVGSGSGWTTALLGHIAGKSGKVIGTEVVPELIKMGQENLLKYPALNVEVRAADDTLGVPEDAPFDRIFVSASNAELPQELIDQLKIGGIMVIPIEHAIWNVTKTSESEYEAETHEGFVFVPLVY